MDAGPVRVRVYAVLVAVAAALLFAAVVAADRQAFDRTPLLLTVVLLVGAAVAQRFPVHLSDQTKVYVDAALFTAAALVLPPAVAMLVAAVAVGLDELILRNSWRQALFNVAQTALYVGAGALTYEWLESAAAPPILPGLERALAVLAAAAVMHLLNTALVAGIVATQLRRNPYRIWREGLWLDMPQHVALVAIGVMLAIVARDYPWLTPLFAAPLGFVYLSLRRSLQLRRATRLTLFAAADLVELLREGQAGHARRVAQRARLVAERLGLEPTEVEAVETAARLHHLGDLGSRAEAVGGAAAAGEAESPNGAREPLVALPAYAASATTIRHLTERWDGTGYPDRLAGEAIPLPSRIIAVADAFDRLLSEPGGRCRSDPECALATLGAGASRDWDPRVVEELVALVRSALVAGEPVSTAGGPSTPTLAFTG